MEFKNEEYQKLYDLTGRLHEQKFEVSEGFMEVVMKKIASQQKLVETTGVKRWRKVALTTGVASIVTVFICVLTVTFLGQKVSTSFKTIGSALPAASSPIDGTPYNVEFKVKKHSNAEYVADTPSLDRSVGENYGQYEENPRVATANQPVSTFSIDVDNGSYTNVRRLLQSGQRPPTDSVRTEEFINYFNYNYAAPTDGRPFFLNYEAAPSPLEKGRYLLKLGIKAKDSSKDDTRGWNLVFLVDVSGSMSEELPLVKKGMRILAERMRPIDRLAIVTYAGEEGLALPSTPGSEKERIYQVIETLGAGGSTNGSGGINLAYKIAEENRRTDGVNRIILATDGDFNVGITSFDQLVQLVEEKRKSGITLTTLGVGEGNYNERNLEQLADKGNGNYFYLDSTEEAARVLGSKLTSNIEVVAKDVKLQIEFNPAVISGYRLIGYDNRKLQNQDFNNDAIDAGEIGSGHTVTALYEIIPANSPFSAELFAEPRYDANKKPTLAPETAINEMAFLKIRYKEPNGDTSKLLEFPLAKSEIKESAQNASTDFRFAAAVSYFGQILRGSRYLGDYSTKDILKLASDNLGEDFDRSRKEFITLIEKAIQVGVGR
jgi:Ca-activated chloride channel family protein